MRASEKLKHSSHSFCHWWAWVEYSRVQFLFPRCSQRTCLSVQSSSHYLENTDNFEHCSSVTIHVCVYVQQNKDIFHAFYAPDKLPNTFMPHHDKTFRIMMTFDKYITLEFLLHHRSGFSVKCILLYVISLKRLCQCLRGTVSNSLFLSSGH